MNCSTAVKKCSSRSKVSWSVNKDIICYPQDPSHGKGDCGGSVVPAFFGRIKLVAPYTVSISNVGTNESGLYECNCPFEQGNPTWSIQIKIVGE